MEPIPRFWASRTTTVPTRRRGEVPVDVWGWSDRSREDALSRAELRARDLAARGIEDARAAEYYPGRPVREEILEEVRDEDGALLAVITRNRCGTTVLNTDAVLIADVDLPAAAVARGRRGSERRAGTGACICTAAGFRALISGTGAAPGSERARGILDELGSDPLYVRLCVEARRVWWNGGEPRDDAERRLLALHDERSGADSGQALA